LSDPNRVDETGARSAELASWARGLGPLLLLFGWLALWTAGDAAAPPGAGEPSYGSEESGPWIVDAQTAWRLRRVALAISTPRLEQVDSFLSFPGTIDTVDLPVYDELVALTARAVTAGRVGGPRQGVDTALLEHLALRFGPLLGGLALLALYASLRQTTPASGLAAAGACVFVGAAPAWLEAARPGVLRIELLAALACVIGLRVLLSVFRAHRPVDRFTHAMVAGAAFGFGLATTPLFLVPVAAAWFAFLRQVLRAPVEERDDVGRTFLLFWITVSLGGLLPSIGGPWLPAQDGIVSGWTRLVSELALVGALPFAFVRFAPGPSARLLAGKRGFVVAAIALVGALALLHGAGPDHPRTALLFAALGLGEQGWDARLGALEVAGLLAWGVAAIGLLRATLEPESRDLLAGVALLAGLAAVVHPPVALLAAAPVAVGAAAWFDAPRVRLAAGVACVAIAVALANATVRAARRHATGAGLEAVLLGRALRREEPEPRGWNSVRAVQRSAVLCAPGVAPLVAWHARLPCATLGPARNGDPSGRHSIHELLAEDTVEGVLRRARRGRLGYLVVGPAGLAGPGLEALAAAAEDGLPGVRGVQIGESRLLVLHRAP